MKEDLETKTQEGSFDRHTKDAEKYEVYEHVSGFVKGNPDECYVQKQIVESSLSKEKAEKLATDLNKRKGGSFDTELEHPHRTRSVWRSPCTVSSEYCGLMSYGGGYETVPEMVPVSSRRSFKVRKQQKFK